MKGAGSIVSIDDSASVEDLTLGLDWTQWLLRSVRQRCAGVILPEQPSLAALAKVWPAWLTGMFIPRLGPFLLRCADVANRQSHEELANHEQRWAAMLNADEAMRSARAGAQLLRSVKGARHAGALILLQEACAAGAIKGHIGLVWPAVASLFQLSPGVMLAEYLRLEFHCAGRRLAGLSEDAFRPAMVQTVQKLLSDQTLPWRDGSEAMDLPV